MTSHHSSFSTRRGFARLSLGALSTFGLGACDGAGFDSGDAPDTGIDLEALGACDHPAATWAGGGTAAMIAASCYPDPFAGAAANCPLLLCETTAGPCTSDSPERRDISEGFEGLPLRLALRVVDADTCDPIAGVAVDVWHTNRAGVYSGVTPSKICSRGDIFASGLLAFRGTQITGEGGRVEFDTCFPGWYPGRTVHIHLRVRAFDVVYATTQLVFADALVAEIFGAHPEYREFGRPEVSNRTDFILGNAPDRYLVDTARMPDGAMLASRVLAIRRGPPDPGAAAGC